MKVLTTEELLAALDTQIKFEADNQRNEGWTRWAIWGALATLLWIATDLWTRPSLDCSRMAVIAMLVFVLWEFLKEAIWLLLPSSRIEVGPPRFWLAVDKIHPLRPETAVVILQSLLVMGTLAYFAIPGQRLLWVYASLVFGLNLGRFVSSAFLIGLPAELSLKGTINVITYAKLIWLIGICWQVATVIRSNFEAFTLADVRLALVLNGIAFLIFRLVASTSSEHLLSKLTQLRQHIAFGRIELPDANKKTEALLTGVTLEELLSPLIQAIRDEAAKLSVLLSEARLLLDKAQEKLSAQEQSPHEALRILDQMGSPPTIIIQQTKKNRKAWNLFAGHALGLAFYYRELKLETKDLESRMRSELAPIDAEIKTCFERYTILKVEARNLAVAQQNEN